MPEVTQLKSVGYRDLNLDSLISASVLTTALAALPEVEVSSKSWSPDFLGEDLGWQKRLEDELTNPMITITSDFQFVSLKHPES